MPVSASYRQIVLGADSAVDDVPAPRQRPSWRRTLVAAAATAVVAGVALHRTSPSAAFSAARDIARADEEKPPRACIELPGVRLQNGAGTADGSGKKAKDGPDCAARCRSEASCGQAVFSSGNSDCYMFKKVAPGLQEYKLGKNETPSKDVFDSAVCGEVEELAVAQAEARKTKVAAVKKSWDEAEARADKLLKTLQLNDKLTLTHGSASQSGFAGYLAPSWAITGAKPLTMNDGPQGFNPYTDPALAGTSTQYPSLLTVAATFNPAAARRYAGAIVEEFVGKGSNTLLGPDLEVTRVGSTGRSFETLSGEDPFLGASLAAPFVEEVQKNGIIATIKHWLDNNQEIGRMTMDVEIGDRAQHEIYMPPFKAAIEAGAGAVMCAYNKVYGTYACENHKLLKELLRGDAGFRGMIMSDWGATHDAKNSVVAGLDVEMPGNGGKFEQLPQLVGSGEIEEAAIDKMAGHVLSTMYHTGHFDGRYPAEVPSSVQRTDVTSDDHRAVAAATIVDGAVLLKNRDNTLPLEAKGKKIAMLGTYCKQKVFVAPDHVTASLGTPFMGQGSGYVPTTRTVSPLEGMQAVAKDAASIEWSGDAAAAEGADIAIICASACDVHEGWDRMNYSLPEARALVKGVRKLNPDAKVVLVGITPGAVTTEWATHVDAALLLFMPGEQVGTAVARMLTGEEAPAGRLPITMPPDGWKPIGGYPAGKGSDHLFLSAQYPGTQPPPHKKYKWGEHLIANFTESVLIGYRWYDANDVEPAFPFGFGLTYTEFALKAFKVKCMDSNIVVSVTIENKGKRDGKAVPQLYVGFKSLEPAIRQLKGFQKLSVPAGGEAHAVFVVTPEDASYYDEGKKRWVSAAEKGEDVTVSVGMSSRDLVFKKSLSCASEE